MFLFIGFLSTKSQKEFLGFQHNIKPVRQLTIHNFNDWSLPFLLKAYRCSLDQHNNKNFMQSKS
jgi:hypothetical protein